jgi:hypothetical protein
MRNTKKLRTRRVPLVAKRIPSPRPTLLIIQLACKNGVEPSARYTPDVYSANSPWLCWRQSTCTMMPVTWCNVVANAFARSMPNNENFDFIRSIKISSA